MGRMLDAVERARQEREKRFQMAQQGGAQPASPLAAAPGPSPAPAAQAAPAVRDEPPPAWADDSQDEAREEPLQDAPPTQWNAEPASDPPGARGSMPNATLIPSLPPVGVSDLVVGAHDFQSPITEQVRLIRTNLETVLADHPSRTIVITSPVSGDGKTVVASNLATVLADTPERQVLLIDADMRKPDVNTLFSIKLAPGLSECLRGQCSPAQAVQATSLPNLWVMAAGREPQNSTVLLGSERMSALLADLQRTYSWIIFDTPPMLPVTDASVLARHCTGLILVVRMGKTRYGLIERAQQQLAELRLPVLGCILNDMKSFKRDNEYYGKYYRRAGAGNSKSKA